MLPIENWTPKGYYCLISWTWGWTQILFLNRITSTNISAAVSQSTNNLKELLLKQSIKVCTFISFSAYKKNCLPPSLNQAPDPYYLGLSASNYHLPFNSWAFSIVDFALKYHNE